ncbi:MAG: hypothetical protein V4690_02885 [Patescibacteria group bacterium]
MKKFFSYIFIGIVFSGILFPFTSSLAQVNGQACTGEGGKPGKYVNYGDLDGPNWVCILDEDGSDEAVNEVRAANQPGPSDGCTFYRPSTWIFGCFLESIGVLILGITSGILWLAGSLLNMVLDITIMDMSTSINQFEGINTGWKLIRDMINIVFIFMLVWHGIQMIIGQISTDYVKKFVGFLVLASLLVNFSLFFTKVMIDASNAVTIGLYNAILDETDRLSVPGGGDTSREAISGLSVAYMKALDLNKIYSGETFAAVAGTGPEVFVGQLMGAILFIVTSFVFFAISIFFIIRYVTLLVLLMLSPVAIMGMALPAIKTYSNQWWDSLKGQLIFPPVFMLMTWVVLTLLSSDGFIRASQGPAAIGTQSLLSLFFNFTIIIGLAIFTLITAKTSATQGSKLIGQATGRLSKLAGGAVFGGAAALGRNTIGRAGNAIANSDYLKDKAATGGLVGRNLAKITVNRGERARTATFDGRASAGMSSLISQTGVDMGKAPDAKKLNFKAIAEKEKKDAEEAAKKYKPNEDMQAEAEAADKVEVAKFDAEISAAEAAKKKAEEENKAATKSIKEGETRIEELRMNLQSTTNSDERRQIADQIEQIENRNKSQRDSLQTLRENIALAETAVKKAEENKATNYKSEAARLKKVFTDRVEAVEKRTLNPGRIMGTAQFIGGLTGLTNSPINQSERRAIASAAKKALQGKSKEEKAMEELMKAAKKRVEEEAKESDADKPKAEEAAAPKETPPATPTA